MAELDLRGFVKLLEARGELVRVRAPVVRALVLA
jgi:3-polyprenyl-4-hydroxybenzoate decarboxylase